MKYLEIGQCESISKTITEKDVLEFAYITGDCNPIHVNEEEASKSIFGKRVAHGMLVGSLVSAVLGMKLPGKGTIYLEQVFKFLKPVFLEDTVTVIVTVDDIINREKGIYKLSTIVKNQNDEITHDGYAVVKYI